MSHNPKKFKWKITFCPSCLDIRIAKHHHKNRCDNCQRYFLALAYIPRQPCALKKEGKWYVDIGFTREDVGDLTGAAYYRARDAVCNIIFPGIPPITDTDPDGLRDLMTARLEQMIQDTLDPKLVYHKTCARTDEDKREHRHSVKMRARAEIFLEDFATICEYLDYDVDELRDKLIRAWNGDMTWDKRQAPKRKGRKNAKAGSK